jgi:hypothetical protein
MMFIGVVLRRSLFQALGHAGPYLKAQGRFCIEVWKNKLLVTEVVLNITETRPMISDHPVPKQT